MIRIGALCVLLAGCSPTIYTHGVPNFAVVEPGVYRGGEPTAAGWQYLRSIGVRAVVQLDYDEERPSGVDVPGGLDLVRVSMPPNDGDDLLRGPTRETLLAAYEAIARHARGIYVHCLHGQDRTGLVIAVFRRLGIGWTKQRAFAEALHLGFHPEFLGIVHAWEQIP